MTTAGRRHFGFPGGEASRRINVLGKWQQPARGLQVAIPPRSSRQNSSGLPVHTGRHMGIS